MANLNASFFPKSRPLDPRELPAIYKILRGHFGHQSWWPGDTPFEVMVGAILTQNTAWTNVEKAIANLKNARVLSLKAFRKISSARLATLIRPSGYFNVKSKRLKALSDFIAEHYSGSLKKMFTEELGTLRLKLLSVHGIGEETADSILLYAADKRIFVIDAYTRRIFSRHRIRFPRVEGHRKGDKSGWRYARKLYKSPYQEWQSLFMTHLTREKLAVFNDFHAQIVQLAKTYCRPRNPDCSHCPLRPYL